MSMATADTYYSFKCAIASFFANYVVGILHPLQLLKTRLQSHDGKLNNNLVPKYSGIIQGMKHIYHNEGFIGLFKGIHFTTFTSSVASALFFWIYQKRKLYYEETRFQMMPATAIASLEASIITTILTQPFWVVKTRVLLNTNPHLTEFQNMKISSIQILKQHGLKGLYLGLLMNLMLAFTGSIQMYIYQGSKIIYDNVLGGSKIGQKNFICGSLSKFISTIATYPLTTIRTRAQQNQYISNNQERKYNGSLDIAIKISKEEGYKGFFKGLWPNLIRGMPHRGIYFYFYEIFKGWLINNKSHSIDL